MKFGPVPVPRQSRTDTALSRRRPRIGPAPTPCRLRVEDDAAQSTRRERCTICIDVDTSSSSRTITESGALAAGDAPRPTSPLLLSDQSASFIQVVVQKHRRTEPTGSRLPAASSPAVGPPTAAIFTPTFPKTVHENGNVPAAVLLACPAFTALNQQSWDKVLSCVNETRASEAFNRAADPERIEVYSFEGGTEYLWARASPTTRVERAARRVARPAAAMLRELLAVPRVLFSAVVAVVIQLERCVLESVRGAVCGAVAAAADAAVVPALAQAHAAARPALLCAAHATAALRRAARPLAAALGDALEPLAHLLASLRLVHVERACACAHHAPRAAPTHRHQCTQV
ncbi:unnamed protein product, partial [Brenthis ino]